MKILILSPYPPYPPHGGGTMRIERIVRGLAARHDLTCLTFAPDASADAAMAPLREACRVVTVLGPPQRSLAQRAWTTVAARLPDMALRNASRGYAAALRDLLTRERFDLIQAESIEMAPYLLAIRRWRPADRPALVFDTFNVEYVLQRRAALMSLRAAVSRRPQAWIRNLAGGAYSLAQWAKLAAYERRALRECDAVAAVSEDDARLLGALAPATPVGVVPNGVDSAGFSRAALSGLPAQPGAPAVVFSGTLDFRANVDAITWFAGSIWPLVQAQRPDARLVVVGKRPAPALRALAEAGVLELTGEVPDARPYMAGAAVYIVPMRIGGGVRLKLLEALALEAPVVSTSMGAEGVAGLRGGEHCLLADEPAAFAGAVVRLIAEPELGRRLGAAGRALVAGAYDWSAIIPRLEQLHQVALGDQRR